MRRRRARGPRLAGTGSRAVVLCAAAIGRGGASTACPGRVSREAPRSELLQAARSRAARRASDGAQDCSQRSRALVFVLGDSYSCLLTAGTVRAEAAPPSNGWLVSLMPLALQNPNLKRKILILPSPNDCYGPLHRPRSLNSIRLSAVCCAVKLSWPKSAQDRLTAQSVHTMAKLLLIAATATALRPAATPRTRLTQLRAEPLAEARNALRGAAAAVEPQLKALEREVQDAKNAADAAQRATDAALARAAAAEAAARTAETERQNAEQIREQAWEAAKAKAADRGRLDQALAECAKAEEAARNADEETKRAIAVDGGSANIDALKAAAEKADAAALKADETMAQEVDRIGDAAAAKLDKAAAQAEALRKELKEDPSDATAGVALGAAGLAGFLLLAGIGGPGAGVVGACGGALALLTFGSVPAEKQ